MSRIDTFDDWIDQFKQWQEAIGLTTEEIRTYDFTEKFGEIKQEAIEFGDFKGRPKWETVLQIPDQRVRDTLLNLIVYQGDTEFASVEQQRNLFETSPGPNDRASLARVMAEEMRHGWQMCYLLVKHFGYSGKVEAQKLLERRSWKNTRLLGSFNQDVNNWLDFYVYTNFVDRDGKFQLQMLTHSSFAPLGRSTAAMLREEAYHLATGFDGLSRVLKAGKVPVPLFQKYLNKWVPTAYDLFGNDHSSSAHWCYVWGLKGRFDEAANPEPADPEHLNEASRMLYVREVAGLIDKMNRLLPDDEPKLYAPDHRFHRSIGDYTGKRWSAFGEELDEAAYAVHLTETLPTPEDNAVLTGLMKEPDWVQPKKSA